MRKGRARAAEDRQQAARNREQTAGDRVQAQAARDELPEQPAAAKSDGLTGAVACDRPGGFDRAIDRAHRTMAQLVIVHVAAGVS